MEDIKRGVLQAGGFPLEFPVMALGEIFVKPTTMMYRNFLAMQVEEMIRANPVDGVVLMGGCDRLRPPVDQAHVAPACRRFIPAGPMLRGNLIGENRWAAASDVWKFWADKRAGLISDAQWEEMENGIARSYGLCMTMGTASTMTSLAEVMGLSLPGASSIPAADAAIPAWRRTVAGGSCRWSGKICVWRTS